MSTLESQTRSARLADADWQSSAPGGGLFSGTGRSLREIAGQRELLGLLVRRELKARYKDSTLGFLWSLLRPLSILLVYYVAIGKFLGAERSIPEFAIYIFTGLMIWQLFAEIVSSSTGSIVSNAGLVRKIYLPREVFPLATVGSALFNFLTQLVILIPAILLAGSIPSGTRLLYVPLSLAVIVVFATAIGMALAAVNVYLRDVQYLVEISLTILFWASPVVYSWALVRDALGATAENLYLDNPITLAVLGMQRALWVAGTDQPVPDGLAGRLGVALLVGLVLLWLAQRLFARLEGNFAQEL
ncbi:sugar ABC transporter [Geodermatophilus sp. Leaf369]|uniref:ABC transporter permease n=1 Tax=Geodermatophilus sp. Leaf369 TaxID=1736354 RepID=UPI0006F3A418|nr:ABC transporter permease [Geodermatophilus sp. Leaf369]KQS58084.1 sugar ABC transporter [Geodermatophilus sp. Leaf369]